MDISIVIPLYNEEESLPELSAWIAKVMAENRLSYEIIMIDDGSFDDSWNVIENLSKSNTYIKGIKLQRNYGKSAALHCGFSAAQGDVVVTMDADLQDSPDELPELYRMIKEEKFDLVSGWKRNFMIHCQKDFPVNFTMPLFALYRGLNCTTLIAD